MEFARTQLKLSKTISAAIEKISAAIEIVCFRILKYVIYEDIERFSDPNSLFIPPENIRKHLFHCCFCFRGSRKEIFTRNGVNETAPGIKP